MGELMNIVRFCHDRNMVFMEKQNKAPEKLFTCLIVNNLIVSLV